MVEADLSDNPIGANSPAVNPVRVIITVHELPLSNGCKDIAIILEGTQEGEAVAARMDSWAWPHERWGMGGGKLIVATPPAIRARRLAGGRFRQLI
jgi:hypothetical protein